MVRYNLRSRPHFSLSFPTALANPSRRARSSGSARCIPHVSPIPLRITSTAALANLPIGACSPGSVRRILPGSPGSTSDSSSMAALTNLSIGGFSLGSVRCIPPGSSNLPIQPVSSPLASAKLSKTVRWAPQADWPPPVPPMQLRSILKTRPIGPRSWYQTLISAACNIRSLFTVQPRKTVSWRSSLVDVKFIPNRDFRSVRTFRTVLLMKSIRRHALPFGFSNVQANRPPSVNPLSGSIFASSDYNSSSIFPSEQFIRPVTVSLQPEVTLVPSPGPAHRPHLAYREVPAPPFMAQVRAYMTGWFNFFRSGG